MSGNFKDSKLVFNKIAYGSKKKYMNNFTKIH